MGFSLKSITKSFGGSAGSIIGGAVGGPFGAAVGGMIGNAASDYSANSMAQDAATQAYNRNIELWNMNNQYNSPAEQMKRLKEAGLNPNLVYGNGSVVGNTSGQAAGATPYGVTKNSKQSLIDELAQTQVLESNDVNIQNKRAETSNILAQNRLLAAQVAKTMAEISNLGQQGISLTRENAFYDDVSRYIGSFGSQAGGKALSNAAPGFLKSVGRTLGYAMKYNPVGRLLYHVVR